MRIFSTLVFYLAPPTIAAAVVLALGLAVSIPGLVIFIALTWGLHKGLVKWRTRPVNADAMPGDGEAPERTGPGSDERHDAGPETLASRETSEMAEPGADRQRQRELETDKADFKYFLRGAAAALLFVFVSVAVLATAGVMGDDLAYWMVGVLVAGFATLVSLGILVVWVLPLHLYLFRKNRTGIGWYIFGSLPPSIGFLLMYQPWKSNVTPEHVSAAWACVFIGICAAVTFWYFSVYRRRTAAPGPR